MSIYPNKPCRNALNQICPSYLTKACKTCREQTLQELTESNK